MLGNRQSQHSFAQTPSVNSPRSTFNRSHTAKDSFGFDVLQPVLVDEVLPGDTHKLQMHMFARLQPQVVPIMDNLYIDFFFFYVPSRLLWDNFEKMMGAQDNPGDSIDFIMPVLTSPPAGGFVQGSLADAMGIPTKIAGLANINCLPFRAYALIWNEWFRDQNTQSRTVIPKGNGPDAWNFYSHSLRNRRHDYFSSALPWPQKGPNVTIPIAASASVVRTSNAPGWVAYNATVDTRAANGPITINDGTGNVRTNGSSQISLDPNGGLVATLGTAVAGTINQLREAFQMQQLFETDARGGTRYIEILRAHFNVVSPDFRLQRPEYLGGGQVKINSHPVAATATTDDSSLAELGAFATASSQGRNIGFAKSFIEHGYIIGLACGRADVTYQQGLNRMWSKRTRYDLFWPELANLGEQTILNKELYAQGTAADNQVFAYQERWSEYRYKPSEVRGAFRSNYTGSLDMWHMADDYGSLPQFNSLWMLQDTPIERALVVTTEPPILMDMFFEYRSTRPMPTYSIPASLGRF